MISLETILTHPKAFGLETATNVQRAICRASDGEPLGELWEDPDVRACFGGTPPPEVAPDSLVVLAAIRCGKSKIAAAKAFCASQNVDLSVDYVSDGDEFRIPIVAPETDKGRAVFTHLDVETKNKEALRSCRDVEHVGGSDAIYFINQASGKLIEVQVSALAKHGRSLVARWLPSLIFDEAPLMAGETDAKKNLTEAIRASEGRILPGGQTLYIGSPWAPFGPVYDMVQEFFGKPTKECVVIRAPGPMMNPRYWTPERCAKYLAKNPSSYRTNVLAEFADPEEALFPSQLVEDAMHEFIPSPTKGHHYCAAMDPATRGNAWTFMIGSCLGFERYRVEIATQKVGSKRQPLKPREVLGEWRDKYMKPYGLTEIRTDQHQFDSLQQIASDLGIYLIQTTISKENRLPLVERVRMMLIEDQLDLPKNTDLRQDLVSARRRVTINGVTLALPKTADGRHADYVPTIGLLFEFPPEPPDEPEKAKDELAWLDEEREIDPYDQALARSV